MTPLEKIQKTIKYINEEIKKLNDEEKEAGYFMNQNEIDYLKKVRRILKSK